MSDVAQAGLWFAVLATAISLAIALRRMGLASTYVRDLLHVGAGVWVFGWPYWKSAAWPIGLTAGALMGVVAVPSVAPRWRFAAAFQDSVTSEDERFAGLVRYLVSYLCLTAIGLTGDPFPAAAALLALSFGDGLGGAVGRRFGVHRFTAPGAKQKSLEGSLAVLVFAAAGTLAVAAWLGAPAGLASAFLAGAVAAVIEALSPEGTDNLFVPLAVWVVLQMHP